MANSMANSMADSKPEVQIVGGGFSGLTSAYYLVKAGYKVKIFERNSQPGGLVRTLAHPSSALIETAANGVMNTALFTEMINDIQLPVESPLKESRRRFLFRSGKPTQFPFTFGEFGSLLAKIAPLLLNKKKFSPLPGETLSQWGERCLNKAAADYLLSPAFSGIYGLTADKLSASLVLRKLFKEKEKKQTQNSHDQHSSPINIELKKTKFKKGLVSPQKGLGQLMQALTKYLEASGQVEFLWNTPFEFKKNGFNAKSKDSSPSLARPPRPIVVLATSAQDAAALIYQVDPELGSKLKAIEMLSLASATLIYDKPQTEVQGFGCLFPPKEKFHTAGVLFNSYIFSHRQTPYSETWILSGDFCHKPNDEILKLILEDRQRVIKGPLTLTDHQPKFFSITKWPEALPKYNIQLETVLSQLPRLGNSLICKTQNVYLIGNYLGQIGLSGIQEIASQLPNVIS